MQSRELIIQDRLGASRMIKHFTTASLIITGLTVCNLSFAQTIPENIITTPISSFNKENLEHIKNNDITKDFLKIITYIPDKELKINDETINIDYGQMFKEANEKFAQGNITTAYKDYKDIVAAWTTDDFVNLGLAYKFANMGLFSLAQEAINNIHDRELYNNQIQLIKSNIFPQVILSYDEEIKLAQNYTEIYYNNLAFEVAREMSKNYDKYKRSDYGHYILSQAYYGIKEYNKSINEINRALSINPDNINYQKYKAQILCETNKLNESIKILDMMLDNNISVFDFQKDIESLRYYTLAKGEKKHNLSKCYLANYFIKNNDIQRAIKELNQNITSNKKDYRSMTLLADIYFSQNRLADAMDMYEKSYKIKKNYTATLMGVANMYLIKKDYKNAAEFFIRAYKQDKNKSEALITAALCYKNLGMIDKSIEFTNKVFEKNKLSGKIYYTASKIDDIKEIQYLKKTVSIDPMFIDAWLALADIAIKNKKTDLAISYLKPVKYLDNENYKYYYYQGLVNKQRGQQEDANLNFKKALQINPLFVDASNELNNKK